MNYTHPTYRIMKGFINDYLHHSKKISILDYGCGSGYLLGLLPIKVIKKYVGYETSQAALDSAKIRYGKRRNTKFIKVDTSRPLFFGNRKFDVVIAIGVLQYMTDRQIDEFVRRSSKVLRKGGLLLISTVSDHSLYKIINIYGIVLPNRFINKNKISSVIKKAGFDLDLLQEKGIFFGPLFYHNLSLIFDLIDKIFFRTKGTLGFFGKISRKFAYFLAEAEYALPLSVGYTIYIRAIKK